MTIPGLSLVFFRDSGSPGNSKKRSLREVCIGVEVGHIVMILELVDKFLNGFDTCRDTPEGEEVDDNGCGKETQQPEGDLTGKHHPLGYWVDHTTGTIIVDKEMKQRVWWGDKDWVPDLVIEDIMFLLEE